MANSGKAAARRPDGMPVGTPFPKGTTGNPNGRPIGVVSIKMELQRLLSMTLKGQINPMDGSEEASMPVARKIALNLIKKAATDGDMWAAFRIMEQMDGKPAQALNVGGQDGDNPVVTRGELVVTLVKAKGSSNG